MSRFIVLSGPSCIGKSPLTRAIKKLYPALWQGVEQPVLYNCRDPRPGETDGVTYHFRSREFLEGLRGRPGMIVMDVRRDIQALDMADLLAIFERGHNAFFEGNPYVADALLKSPELRGVELVTVFMAPLSAEELAFLRDNAPASVKELVADVMRRKLLRRTQRQKGVLSQEDLEDIEARAGAAYLELGYASDYQYVLPNHDGEDSENWDAFYYPLGDARKCVLDFVAILEGRTPQFAEQWETTNP